MMKSVLALSLALFCSSLMAMPKVGDSATYQIVAQGYNIVQKVELTAFNPSSNSYTRLETTTFQGQQSQKVTTVSTDELATDANIDMLLTYCESSEVNGKLETVTVPAGTFKACSFFEANSNGRVSISHVPFGLVTLSSPEANVKLIEYRNGN